MFERFTTAARQVVVLAQEEARAAGHGHIGTEHVLLALIAQGSVVVEVLEGLGAAPDEVRDRVWALAPPRRGASLSTAGARSLLGRRRRARPAQIPFTPRAKKVFELALSCAVQLGAEQIAPEHLLLGLTRERDGVAGQALAECGVDDERAWAEVSRRRGSAGGVDGDERSMLRLAEAAQLRAEVARLRHLLEAHGIDPDA